jgi:hypothetical protein
VRANSAYTYERNGPQRDLNWTDVVPYPPLLAPFFEHIRRYSPRPKSDFPRRFVHGAGSQVWCGGRAIVHSNFSEFENADIVMVSDAVTGFTRFDYDREVLPPRLPHQLWVLHFIAEPFGLYPGAANPDFMRRFNVTIGYHRGFFQIFRNGYVNLDTTPSKSKNFTAVFEDTARAPVVALFSNCRSTHRLQYLQKFMREIPVDSLGECLRNKNFTLTPEIQQRCRATTGKHFEGTSGAICNFAAAAAAAAASPLTAVRATGSA